MECQLQKEDLLTRANFGVDTPFLSSSNGLSTQRDGRNTGCVTAEFAGQTTLVTGGAMGIGRVVAGQPVAGRPDGIAHDRRPQPHQGRADRTKPDVGRRARISRSTGQHCDPGAHAHLDNFDTLPPLGRARRHLPFGQPAGPEEVANVVTLLASPARDGGHRSGPMDRAPRSFSTLKATTALESGSECLRLHQRN
jgi:NAD(P)-dependent dehydrogenase (short-subunit alcohol dehydrogenase family)